MSDIESEADSLRADLQILLVEINRVGPPDPDPGVFAPDGDHERLITRWWETRRQLARVELTGLSRTLLDSVRTVLALESAKPQLARVELTGLKVSVDQFDELGIRLRRAQLERDFRTALHQANEDRDPVTP